MNTVDQLLERLEAVERAATGPPAETGERVWTAIEDRLANGPAPPEIDDAPLLEHVPQEVAANAGASSSVALKVVGVLAIVGVIGGGVALANKRERAQDPVRAADPVSAADPVEAVAPEAASPEPAPPEPAALEPEPLVPSEPPPPLDPSPEESPSKPKTPQKAPAQPKSLADEVALMQSLSTALKQEDSSKVLELVAEHERDFPKGQFIEERRAAKARALCKSGKLAAGKREAEQFAVRWPRSIHLPFVNEDCGLE